MEQERQVEVLRHSLQRGDEDAARERHARDEIRNTLQEVTTELRAEKMKNEKLRDELRNLRKRLDDIHIQQAQERSVAAAIISTQSAGASQRAVARAAQNTVWKQAGQPLVQQMASTSLSNANTPRSSPQTAHPEQNLARDADAHSSTESSFLSADLADEQNHVDNGALRAQLDEKTKELELLHKYIERFGPTS